MTDDDYLALMRADIVPEGSRGLWAVERFDLRESHNMRGVVAPAGVYTALRRLEEATDGPGDCGLAWRTWMSDVPLETHAALPFVRRAHGDVLVTGLGLGTILRALSANPDVRLVTVIERDPTVRALVWPTYADDPKLQLVAGDALEVDLGETFSCAWHDIWPTISASENIPQMLQLRDRFSVSDLVMFWSLPDCLVKLRRAERRGKLPHGTADQFASLLRRRPR